MDGHATMPTRTHRRNPTRLGGRSADKGGLGVSRQPELEPDPRLPPADGPAAGGRRLGRLTWLSNTLGGFSRHRTPLPDRHGTGYEGQRAAHLSLAAQGGVLGPQSVAEAVSPCEPRTLGLPREPSGGPRAHRECSRSLLLELSSRANTDYPLTLSKTCSVTLDSSRDCR